MSHQCGAGEVAMGARYFGRSRSGGLPGGAVAVADADLEDSEDDDGMADAGALEDDSDSGALWRATQ